MHDWPLVIFTLCLQASAGLAVLGLADCALLRGEARAARLPVLLPMLGGAGLLAIAGLAASFGHLGYPLNAPNAIRNLGSSWLSREILATSAYIGVVCLAFLATWRAGRVRLPWLTVAAVAGLAATWCMGEVYRSTSVAAWTTPATHLGFFGCLVVLGAVLGLWLGAHRAAAAAGVQASQRLLALAVVAVAVSLLVQLVAWPDYLLAVHAPAVEVGRTFPIASAAALDAHADLRLVRWSVAGVGCLGLAWAAWGALRPATRIGLLAVASALLLVGELAGRYLFFAIHG
ncbi:Dimethyl sulfoxide reductase (plasmid) [Rhodovastum atsumiense]|nr:DmsC/YnfH family molybdoenzyme membrane anchor subunit [Rhodovastum atsumiense]CAH2605666.1 Dimethyl sulfoxide reductase [Rhodovastum atsumiense]